MSERMSKNGSAFHTIIFILLYSSCCCISAEAQATSVKGKTSINVGVILDMDTWVGKMCYSCMSIAVDDFYNDSISRQYRTRLTLHKRSAKCLASALFAAKDLLKTEGVKAIVGPGKAGQSEFVAELGNKSDVPVVSLSTTSPSISRSYIPYSIRMTPNDTYQLHAIASIVRNFGWKDVVLIYEETDYRNDMISSFMTNLESMNIRIRYRSVIRPSATEHDILTELEMLVDIPVRVFIVHLSPLLGPLFFLKAKEAGLMNEDSAWFITEGLTNLLGSMNHSVIFAMRGVIGVTPYIPSSEKLGEIRSRIIIRIIEESGTYGELNGICMHAYDTVWAIAMAAERVFANITENLIKDNAFADQMDEPDISDMGPGILKEILESNFIGLRGEIHLPDGQLKPLALQIVNVIGKKEREIGYWVPTVGISQTPDGSKQPHLLPVIWPGITEPTVLPKGWITSPSRRKLKIGYLTKDAYCQFAKIGSSGEVVTRSCIDVFKTVVEALPYVLPYELVPFHEQSDGIEQSYDKLVEHVFSKKYDAAVGDITMTSNRLLSVEFTVPYTLGGVAMLVPVTYEKKNFSHPLEDIILFTAWVFLFVSAIGIVFIYYFQSEHGRGVFSVQYTGMTRMNASLWSIFSGSSVIALLSLYLLTPMVNSIYFQYKSISSYTIVGSMVAVNSEKKAATLCVQIFMETYIAAFLIILVAMCIRYFNGNSHLTTVDARDLVSRGDFVGYRNGSFVQKVLIALDFQESKLRVYNSTEEYSEALEKGSGNGGVAAVFDEIPYLNAILEKNCGKYRQVGPVRQTKGFRFVFSKGSSLVSDFSKVISSKVETEKIMQIEKIWESSKSRCEDQLEHRSSISFLVLAMMALSFFMITIIIPYGICWTATPANVRDPNTGPPVDVLGQELSKKDSDSTSNDRRPMTPPGGGPQTQEGSEQPIAGIESTKKNKISLRNRFWFWNKKNPPNNHVGVVTSQAKVPKYVKM